jgi:hypothetical protein
MAMTRIQLVNRALAKLERTGAGFAAADSEDEEAMDGYVDGVVEQLSQDNIYSVADLTDIDVAAFEWIADILAMAAALEFRVVPNQQIREYAEYRLRRLTASRPSFSTMKAEYF